MLGYGIQWPTYMPSFQRGDGTFGGPTGGSEMKSTKYQNSLGWLLGFRQSCVPFGLVPGESTQTWCADNTATAAAWSVWAPPDFNTPTQPIPPCAPIFDQSDETKLAGPLTDWKLHDDIPYLYIVLKDYNKNVSSKTVVNALPLQTVVDLPSYAKSVTGVMPTALAQSYSDAAAFPIPLTVNPDNPLRGVIASGSVPSAQTGIGIYDANDGLTKKQLYTIAAIKAARQTRSIYSLPNATNSSDILARIPTKTNNGLRNTQNDKWLVGYGGNLTVAKRVYFGPVDISRLSVQLMDPYGNVLNLHNRDWSFTVKVEHLYQF